MAVKFTKTGFGNEKNNEALLFEFLDHELPDKIELKDKTLKNVNSFVGSLQTAQITGTLIEPISFSGKFFGDYIDNEEKTIRAKERFDQLQNLNGRPVKFWLDGFKVIVIISKIKLTAEDYNSCIYDITLQPHDFILPPVSKLVEPIYDSAVNLFNRLTESSKISVPVVDESKLNNGGMFELTKEGADKINPEPKTVEEKKLTAGELLKKALRNEAIEKAKAKRANSVLNQLNLTDQQINKTAGGVLDIAKEAVTKAQKEYMKFFNNGGF